MDLIKPLKTRHRVCFFGRKLILQYAYRIPAESTGSWEIVWRDATFVQLKEKGE